MKTKTQTRNQARRSKDRRPENTVISFAVPHDLKEAIAHAAEAEGRTMSEWIRWQLMQMDIAS